MSTLTQIEAVIKQLPPTQVRQLAAWLQTYLDEMWDRQIEADLESGKLDNPIAKAEAAILADNIKELDEILDDI